MSAAKPSISVGVAMHKPYSIPADSIYLPIHVGASLHPEVLADIAQDNEGDNISNLNPYYCELTALYWLWKNNDSDYKGLVHYRRYFTSRNLFKRFNKAYFSRILNQDELGKVLRRHKVILPAKRHYFIETIYSHYAHTHHVAELDMAREIIKDSNSDYLPAWDTVMKRRSAHMFNMMIMDKESFNRYCEWLFSILFELTARISPQQYDSFHARYPGRISEILLNVWLLKNQADYTVLPTTYTEPIDWPRKIKDFLSAKFAKKRYSASF